MIRELIDCSSAAIEQKVIRFANTLGQTLRKAHDPVLIELVARSLGYMARHTAVSHADYVENELDRSLEWLRSANPNRMFAACAILREFAGSLSPSYIDRSHLARPGGASFIDILDPSPPRLCQMGPVIISAG